MLKSIELHQIKFGLHEIASVMYVACRLTILAADLYECLDTQRIAEGLLTSSEGHPRIHSRERQHVSTRQ